MRSEDLDHDGYMQRLVTRSIFLSENYTQKERREVLENIENDRDREDLKTVLVVVFNIIKKQKRPKYLKHITVWPTVQMVRRKIKPENTSEVALEIINRKKLYQ